MAYITPFCGTLLAASTACLVHDLLPITQGQVCQILLIFTDTLAVQGAILVCTSQVTNFTVAATPAKNNGSTTCISNCEQASFPKKG